MTFQGSDIPAQVAAQQAARKAVLEAYNLGRTAAGETPNPSQSGLDVLIGFDHETGAEIHVPLSDVGNLATGGSFDPITLEPVQWFYVLSWDLVDIDAVFNYNEGGLSSGPGAILASKVNGSLEDIQDGGSGMDLLSDGYINGVTAYEIPPQVGDRVFFYIGGFWSGIYNIIDVGSAITPWAMVRATDTDDPEEALLDYKVHLVGTSFYARTQRYDGLEDDFGASSEQYGWAIMNSESLAIGPGAIVMGSVGFAVGMDAFAKGSSAIAIARDSHAPFDDSVAIGRDARTHANRQVDIRNAVVQNYLNVLTSGPSIQIDWQLSNIWFLDLAEDTTFTTTALGAETTGRSVTIRINCDGTERNLSFPGWTWVGTAMPTSIDANSSAVLTITCMGLGLTAPTVIATWQIEGALYEPLVSPVTGVAVSTAAIHAALVTLGFITA